VVFDSVLETKMPYLSLVLKLDYTCDDISYSRSTNVKLPIPEDLAYSQVTDDRVVEGLLSSAKGVYMACPRHTGDSDDWATIEPTIVGPVTVVNNSVSSWVQDRWITDEGEDDDDNNDNNNDGEKENEDEDEYEYDRETSDELLEDLKNCVTVKVDTHWNCYCKTTTVCGCGCDPLHVGW